MSRISRLFKNLKFLSKQDLKKTLSNYVSPEEIMANTLYYIPNSSIIRPNVLDEKQTVDYLIKAKQSLVRFGDGEIQIISGKNIPFQDYNEKLATRMREILLNTNDKLTVGINYWYFYPKYNPKQTELSRHFSFYIMPICRKNLLQYIDITKSYCDAGFTGFRYGHKPENDYIYKQLRKLWNKKEIVLVGCREAHQKITYNIYDNASKETWIYTPNKNAFNEYDNILNQIKQHPKTSLIILMVGPTSKVLADDLSKLGYTALDMGHIAKSYDFYKKDTAYTTENQNDFYKPDL